MDEVKLFYTAVAGLVGMATSIFGWLYSRHLGLEAARKSLNSTYAETISALVVKGRVHDETMENLSRRLEDCEKRWDRRRRRDAQEKRHQELIG